MAAMMSTNAWALEASEMQESAHTVGKGNLQLHPGLFQSSYGLSDKTDLRTHIAAQYFGFNAQLKYAVMQNETQALSLEPTVYSEWPWAPLGFPSYSAGARLRYSTEMGNGRLNVGVGAIYDVQKVSFIIHQGDFQADQGIELTTEYSASLFHSPRVWGHEAEHPDEDTWIFSGVRVPVVVGYEIPTSDTSTWNIVVRAHPLNIVNEGSWYAQFNPSWNHEANDRFRYALGFNLVYPGNPLPVADDELAAEIAKAEGDDHMRAWMDKLPQMPVAFLPHVAFWWRL
jgi:hypothetical protein